MDYERFELPNGLRVLAAPMPHVRSVSTAIFIGVGSRYETDSEAGVAHLIEHLMFKGTPKRPSSRLISEPIERIGGVMNASTDKEATVFWTKTAAEHLELSLELLSDMLVNSRLTPNDIVREKSIIVEELAMSRDDPQDWVHNLIDQSMWPDHPIGRDVGGTRESVTTITRAQIRRFITRYYTAGNTVLVVAGGMEPARVRDLAQSHFGNLNGSGSSSFQPAPAPSPSPPRYESRHTEQMHVCIAYAGLPRTSPDRFALDILVTILGGGPTSRLFLEVRERLGLAYDVHAYTTRYADTGSVVVYAGVDSGRAARAVEAIRSEIARLRRRSVSADDIAKTVDYMKGRMYLGLEDTHAVTSWLGAQELLMGQIMSPEELAAIIERITPRQVRAQADRIFDPAEMHIAAMGPNVDAVVEAALG